MICIIGAGAIGRALAAMLQNAGREVMLIRSTPGNELKNNTQHISVHLPDGGLQAEVPVENLETVRFADGPILVTAKSLANDAIAAKLKGTTQPVVLLQNGLNIERPFQEKGISHLYRCVLFVTSQFDADGSIRFRPVSACAVGAVNGDDKYLKELLSLISTPHFTFKAEADIWPLVWKKVIANCVFNSICPLLDTDNGIFHRDENAMAMARRVISECLAVAHKQGITLTGQQIEDSVLAISRFSDGQFISTLQDIRNRRPTEVETLNAEIVRLAGELPVPYTHLLGNLTALKSQLSLL